MTMASSPPPNLQQVPLVESSPAVDELKTVLGEPILNGEYPGGSRERSSEAETVVGEPILNGEKPEGSIGQSSEPELKTAVDESILNGDNPGGSRGRSSEPEPEPELKEVVGELSLNGDNPGGSRGQTSEPKLKTVVGEPILNGENPGGSRGRTSEPKLKTVVGESTENPGGSRGQTSEPKLKTGVGESILNGENPGGSRGRTSEPKLKTVVGDSILNGENPGDSRGQTSEPKLKTVVGEPIPNGNNPGGSGGRSPEPEPKLKTVVGEPFPNPGGSGGRSLEPEPKLKTVVGEPIPNPGGSTGRTSEPEPKLKTVVGEPIPNPGGSTGLRASPKLKTPIPNADSPGGASMEPEPAQVVARLKKQALDNPLKEQSVEQLLSSMGVSFRGASNNAKPPLDYSMAEEYNNSKAHSEIEESHSMDSIPVAVPLSLPGIKKPQNGAPPNDSDSDSGGSSPVILSPRQAFEVMEERSELVNHIRDDARVVPAPVNSVPWKKRGCAGCGRGNMLLEKEYCMACGAKYCGNCLLMAMGSMPEGRKCVSCLGRPILGSRRPFIGKSSRLLKHLLSPLEVQQIMKAEREGPANQLQPEQVVVNNRPLTHDEFASLLSCVNPPLKLKPGRYWYDGQTGLWGKEGHRPDSIVTPSLKLGGNLQPNASNGKTHVFMNGRELGKLELKMLKFAGVNCTPETHLWVEHDGNYSEEGFKKTKGNIWGKEGNLWEKASIKLLYPFFSLPTPRSNVGVGTAESGRHSNRFPGLVDSLRMHKLLLLGHEGSGRSTIFKQAKILYNEGFTKEEVVSFKSLIQANIYKYLAILLEARERFEEEDDELNNNNAAATRASQQQQQSSSSSENNSPPPQAEEAGILKWNNDNKQKATDNNRYRLEPRMKELSDWFMENMHNMDTTTTPALLQQHASKLEQLWLNPAVQATFQRKAQLPFLPDVASVFLDRVVEVCRSDYEPAELDILQTEGLSQGSGLVQIEISLDDKDFGSWQDADTTVTGLDRYQVIRVGGKGMTDRHKWLDMFEDVRAVVFCVSLSDYNKTWNNETTGNPTNKMLQTKDLFESVLRHPCFQDTSFILLLNKYDVFEEKIEKGVPLTACSWFSDFRPVGTSHYTPQNQAQQAYLYIAHKYQELFKSVNCTGRRLFTYQLNALDKSTVSGAFQYVKTVLKWEEHKAAGWGLVEDSSYSTDVSSFSQRSMPRQPDLFRRHQHY